MRALCLGHHREDQAETVCLRMQQGAGMHGMRGMARAREREGLMLYRPLLHVPRQELRQALRRAGVAWLEDASNGDTSLWRNRIRHRLFPAMHAAGTQRGVACGPGGGRAGRRGGDMEAGLARVRVARRGGGVAVAGRDGAGLAPPLRACLLQRMMQALFGPGIVAGRRHIRMVEAWTARDGAGGLDLSRSRLYRRSGRLHLRPAAAGLGETV